MGKAKLPLKKIECPIARNACFNKRKTGVFKKANELAILCGTEIAIIIYNPEKNQLLAFGGPDIDFVLNNYQNLPAYLDKEKVKRSGDFQQVYNSISRALHEEKKLTVNLQRLEAVVNVDSWWTKDIQNLELDELKKFSDTLKGFKEALEEFAAPEKEPRNSSIKKEPNQMDAVQLQESQDYSSSSVIQYQAAQWNGNNTLHTGSPWSYSPALQQFNTLQAQPIPPLHRTHPQLHKSTMGLSLHGPNSQFASPSTALLHGVQCQCQAASPQLSLGLIGSSGYSSSSFQQFNQVHDSIMGSSFNGPTSQSAFQSSAEAAPTKNPRLSRGMMASSRSYGPISQSASPHIRPGVTGSQSFPGMSSEQIWQSVSSPEMQYEGAPTMDPQSFSGAMLQSVSSSAVQYGGAPTMDLQSFLDMASSMYYYGPISQSFSPPSVQYEGAPTMGPQSFPGVASSMYYDPTLQSASPSSDGIQYEAAPITRPQPSPNMALGSSIIQSASPSPSPSGAGVQYEASPTVNPQPSPDMTGSSLVYLYTASQQSNPQVYKPMAESSVATRDLNTIQFNGDIQGGRVAGKRPFHSLAQDDDIQVDVDAYFVS